MSLTALVVDDEAPARKRLRDLLTLEADIELLAECSDGPAAVEAIRAHSPDIVFLDIQMPEMSGFDVLSEVGLDAVKTVVFVTAYDQHAIQAFESRAIDYLLKPFSRERFNETLERIRKLSLGDGTRDLTVAQVQRLLERRSGGGDRIPVRKGTRTRFVDIPEVDWMEADGNYVVLHTKSESHRVRGTLKDFARKMSHHGFIRIHQSYVVNLARIRELQPWSHGEFVVIMPDGAELVSSRTYSGELRRRLQL